jgi:hypothetical protein
LEASIPPGSGLAKTSFFFLGFFTPLPPHEP